MWHFGKYGFTSSVAYDPAKDRNGKSEFAHIVLGDKGLEALNTKAADRTEEQKALIRQAQVGYIAPDGTKLTTHILVRARVRDDLEDLKRVCKSLVIEEDKGADYSFRAVITRDLMKKFMCLHVDDIDYDSHFKEVVKANSSQPGARYSAMMSIWSTMATLQPTTPYGGYGASDWGDYSGTGYFSGGSSKSGASSGAAGKATGGKSGGATGSSASSVNAGVQYAAKDIADFNEKYVDEGGFRSYRNGEGPLTGFKINDRVQCYSGTGTVTAVDDTRKGADMVTVSLDPETGKTAKRTGRFLSNFLSPVDLPDLPEDETEDAVIVLTMDDIYSDVTTRYPNAVGWATTDEMRDWDDDAFEFYTRLQEKFGQEATGILLADINDTFDEVLWEQSSDDEKEAWVTEGTQVPTKYTAEGEELLKKFLASEVSK